MLFRSSDTDSLIFSSKGGMVVRIRSADVRQVGRNTQGVKLVTLDAGDLLASVAKIAGDDGDPLLGRRDPASGQLVKARLDSDDYLLFRALPGNAVEQTAVSPRALRGRALAAPYRDGDDG